MTHGKQPLVDTPVEAGPVPGSLLWRVAQSACATTRSWRLYPAVAWSCRQARRRLADRAAILDVRDRRLAEILRHAFAQVPLYRHLAGSLGLDLRRHEAAACLAALPCLDRELLQEAVAAGAVLARVGPCSEFRATSGTTGRPLVVPRCARAQAAESADLALRLGVMGLAEAARPSFGRANYVYVSDSEYRPALRTFSRRMPLLGWARFRKFDLRTPSADEAGGLVRRIAALKPVVLTGKPSSLEVLADHQARHPAHAIRPALVVTGAERLEPALRQRLADLFHAPVRESYGLTETGTLAVECPEGEGLHLCEDRQIVEVLDDAGEPVPEGEPGELVVTDLGNFAMPLLRYRTGDVGRLLTSPCRCGVAHRRLVLLQGRLVDHFRAADGARISPLRLTAGLRTLPLRQFQVVQLSLQEVMVRYVGDPDESRVAQALRADVEACLGPGVAVRARREAGRLDVPGEKFRPYRCEIQ